MFDQKIFPKASWFHTSALILAAAMARPCLAQLEGTTIPVSNTHPVAAIQDKETPTQRGARMKWWRESRFGIRNQRGPTREGARSSGDSACSNDQDCKCRRPSDYNCHRKVASGAPH
jgi:hypothetical protein